MDTSSVESNIWLMWVPQKKSVSIKLSSDKETEMFYIGYFCYDGAQIKWK